MSNSRIPSPARSQGPPVTPRRYRTRTTLSVGSPARSTASGRLSNIVDQFKESNKDSFAVSPLSKTVLSDNTEIEMPRRKSWWKKVENSRDVTEVLENEKPTDPVNVLEEFDMEVLTQEKNVEEKKNYTIDLPESSDSESIHSIVLPQRKLFVQNENVPQKKYGEVVDTAKDNKTHIEDKTLYVRTKNLFGKTSQRNKPVFPSALLNISPDKTLGNKTQELPAEPKGQAKSLFGRPGTKRKNIFADFIVSESEDEIPEILPKRFTFHKPSEPSRRSSNASSITTDIEMDDWKLLPSSTMVEHQLEVQLITPGKKARLSKLSEAKESTNTDSTKQSDKSISAKNKSKFLSPANNQKVEKCISDKQNSPTKNDLENTAFRKQIATLNKSTTIFDNSKNIPQAQDIPVTEEAKDKSNVNKTYNVNKTNQLSKSRIVENKLDDTPNVQQADTITQKDIVESEPAIEQQEEDEEIALTYEDNDPEDIEGNNDAAKHVIDDKTKTICVDNRLSKVSEYMDNIEKELSRIVGAETNHILQMETPMPNKSVQLVKKVVQETPDSKSEENESRNNNTTKSFENNQRDDTKEDNEQEVEKVIDKDQADVKIENNVEAHEIINKDQTNANDESTKEAEKIINKDQTNAKDDSNKQAEEIINKNQTDANDDSNLEDKEEVDEDQADENDHNNQEVEEELDEDQAEASQEIEASDQEGTEAEIDEEEEVEHEQSQKRINESENQEEIEASCDDEIENNEEINFEAEEEEADDEQYNSQDEKAEDDEVEDDELEVSDDEVQASEDELQANDEVENESLKVEEENESLEVEEENENDSDDLDEEQNESQQIEDDDEQKNSQEMVDVEDQGESQETENEIEGNDSQEMEIDNSEKVQEEAEDEIDQQEIEPQQSTEEIDGNVTHDTTGRNRKKRETNTPEAILHNASNEMDSFTNKGHNTSIRKTKSILKNFTIRPSIAPPRESTGLSDGTKNSSAEGSGWDSHRTTRKTLRQTFGKDFTPRKSLRALVMEKSAGRHRQTQADTELKLHQANSTELPNEQSEMEYEEAISDHEVSKQTRQATLEMYLQKIKKENMEFKEKIEQQVRNSLKSNPGRVDILNFRPTKPSIHRAKSLKTAPKVKRIKSSVINLENLPPELVEDMKYKPPKRFKPGNAAWITKRLYKFLESKLEPKYDYRARIRAEKLVETLYNFVRDIRRVRVAPPHSVAELKREMARLDVVSTHFEFYNFFSDYLPREVKIKVVPDIVNAIPLPREGVFAAITA